MIKKIFESTLSIETREAESEAESVEIREVSTPPCHSSCNLNGKAKTKIKAECKDNDDKS